MGSCLKGKAESEARPGSYRCEKCGGVTADKKHACKPKKIKDKGGKKEQGKK